MGGGQSTAAVGPDGEPPAEAPPQQPSYWQMIKSGYQELVKAIIRPPRAEYVEAHLGPKEFEFCGQRFRRRDFEVTNERGQRLRCSHWEPVEYPDASGGAESGKLPCMVYLHGNSSARLEALPQLSLCLSLGVTLAALDFAGSGLSEGEYVSLGYYEKDDLKALIAELRATGRISCVALWGRSMGAVTALMHGERDPGIAAMVLDSPFSDLAVLADEMVDKGREHGVHVPRFVTRLALRAIRASVQQRAGFSITALAAIQHAPQCFMPALFVAGRDDDFISPSHSRALQAVYGGDSNLLVVEGDHNSMRPRFLYDSVSIFLQQTLPLNEEYVLPGASRFVGLPPWVRIVPDGRGGEVVLWPHVHEDGAEGEEEEDGEEEEYWSGPHVYDDVGHPGSILSGRAGATSVSRPGAGLTREEGIILGDSGEAAGSGAWGEADGQLGFGMTQARQREIQGAVVSMMGGGGSGSNSSSSRGARAPSPFARTTGRRNLAAAQTNTNGDAALAAAAAEWACELCTLINPGRRSRCEACGSAKPPVPRSPRNNNSNNGAPRSPLLSPVPPEPPGGPAAGEVGGEGAEHVPPDDAVAQGGGGPPGAVGGEEGKEEETEEAKAADPNV